MRLAGRIHGKPRHVCATQVTSFNAFFSRASRGPTDGAGVESCSAETIAFQRIVDNHSQSDTPRKAGGLMSGAASKVVAQLV